MQQPNVFKQSSTNKVKTEELWNQHQNTLALVFRALCTVSQFHLRSLCLQVVLEELERLTKSAVSFLSHLRPHLSVEGFQTGTLIKPNMILLLCVRVCVCGWLREVQVWVSEPHLSGEADR